MFSTSRESIPSIEIGISSFALSVCLTLICSGALPGCGGSASIDPGSTQRAATPGDAADEIAAPKDLSSSQQLELLRTMQRASGITLQVKRITGVTVKGVLDERDVNYVMLPMGKYSPEQWRIVAEALNQLPHLYRVIRPDGVDEKTDEGLKALRDSLRKDIGIGHGLVSSDPGSTWESLEDLEASE